MLTAACVKTVVTAGVETPCLKDFCGDSVRWNQVIQVETKLVNETVDQDADSEAVTIDVVAQLSSTAYVMFTSGSTGVPKGVQISQLAAMSVLKWSIQFFGMSSGARYFQSTTFSFDISVPEIFAAVLCGGAVILANDHILTNMSLLEASLRRQRVSMLGMVPTILSAYITDNPIPPCVENVLPCGEVLPPSSCWRFFEQCEGSTKLWNMYGPTESAVYSHVSEVKFANFQHIGGSVPIGKPISGRRSFVLDSNLHVAPVGVPGELFIGGQGLADGYIQQQNLSHRNFIELSTEAHMGNRLYKTGDVVKYRPDGSLDFLGRTDFQVKIRGLRVELGEIESVVGHVASVREAVVMVREIADSEKQLVAYVTPLSASREEVLQECTVHLPQYMVPSTVVCLSEWPRTSSGKIDRNSLPAPSRADWVKSSTEQLAPTTETERIIAAVWKELLGVEEDVWLHDNFFELGGNSLRVMQMLPRLRAALGMGDVLSVPDVFLAPTIGGLSALLESVCQEEGSSVLPTAPPLVAYERHGEEGASWMPVSFAQEHMLVLDSISLTNSYLCLSWSAVVSGAVDTVAMRRSFGWIMRRHQILRMTYRQPVADTGNASSSFGCKFLPFTSSTLRMQVEDVTAQGHESPMEQAMSMVDEEANRGFDLIGGE
eukprot:COSAG05_NODE_3380_length_2099_cov_27.136000_1_plen_657_part_10